MPYFRNFPNTPYKFGNEDYLVDFPNLVAYSDIIDDLKNNGSVYESVTIIGGERPDSLSQRLYGSPRYHWTFALMNDHIREQGWPLNGDKFEKKIQASFPNTVLTTRDSLFTGFYVGSVVTGQTSGATGTIIKRNVNFGQLFIEGSHAFLSNEAIATEEDEVQKSVDLVSASNEYLAVSYYTDGTDHVDIDPFVGPGSGISAVTFYEHYVAQNDLLKSLRVLSPTVINRVDSEYRRVMGS